MPPTYCNWKKQWAVDLCPPPPCHSKLADMVHPKLVLLETRVLAYLVISGTWLVPHIWLSLLTLFEPLVMASWKIFLNIPYLLSPDPPVFSPCQTPKPLDRAHKWEKETRVYETIVLSLLWGGWLAVSFRGKGSSSELLWSSWRHKSTEAGWTPVRCVRQQKTNTPVPQSLQELSGHESRCLFAQASQLSVDFPKVSGTDMLKDVSVRHTCPALNAVWRS